MKWNYYRRFWHNSNEVFGAGYECLKCNTTVVTSSEGSGTRASGTYTLSTVTFATSGERGTLCKVVTSL